MNPCLKFLAGLACVSAAVATPVRAQDDACDVDQNEPQFVTRAYLAVQQGIGKLNSQTDPTAEARSAIRLLTDPQGRDRGKNAVGQAFTLGQALALLLSQPTTPTTGTRGSYGFATNPEAPADLYVLADSVFTVVETLAPQCKAQLVSWRQGPSWMTTMNAALNALAESKLDSAEALARRALILDRNAPYGYVVLGGAARQRLLAASGADKARFYQESRTHLAKALEISQADTAHRDVVRSSHFELGNLVAASIEDAPPAERAARAREAAEHFKQFSATAETDLERADALQKTADVLAAVNDTAGIRVLYRAVSSNAAAHGERTLLTSGILASRFGTPADAASLYNTVLKANAYQRDALRNLSVTLVQMNDYASLLPVSQRLTALDPNNPENWVFQAYAYAGLSERATNAAQRRAYADSSTKYDNLATQMPIRVTFSEFSPMEGEARLRGSIENLGTAPRSYTIIVEMLDKSGNVVATEQAQVGPVAAKAKGEFTVLGKGSGVVSFRYKPLQ